MTKRFLISIIGSIACTVGVIGEEIVSFAATPPQPINLKFPGSEQIKVEQNQISWGTPTPPVIELLLPAGGQKIDAFDQAEFKLRTEFPQAMTLRRIVLRLRDANGELYQFTETTPTQKLQAGINELTYRVDSNAPKASIWGGDANRKIDFPIQVAGVAIDTVPGTPAAGTFRLLDVAARPLGERASISLNTGHRLNLLLPDHPTPPQLTIDNRGSEPLDLKGTVTVQETGYAKQETPLTVTVPAGQSGSITVPGDFTRQGSYQLAYQFQSASGKTYQGTHRVARMNPAGPTPGRAEEFLFGLCGHPERFSPEAAELEALAAGLCGAKILRVDFGWPRIQPRQGEWNFSTYDRLVEVFGRNGVELQCLLGYDAPWAVVQGYQPKNPEITGRPRLPDYRYFAEFAGKVAARYQDRIKYFEIWNEPDLIGFANFAPEQYMELLTHGYNAIKHVAPDAKVMNGGIASTRSNRSGNPNHNCGLLDLLKADGGKHFDLFAYHGHGSLSSYRDGLEDLKKIGLLAPDTPWGWYSNETAETSAVIGEERQAASLFKKLLTAWSEGAMGYNWYLLREKEYYPMGHHERHFGLITADFEPKAGYVTYNMLANEYQGGKFLRQLPLGKGLSALLFSARNGQELLALWSDGQPRTLLLSGLPAGTVRIDLYGNETTVKQRDGLAYLKLSELPFTLKFPRGAKPEIRTVGELLSSTLPQQLPLSPESPANLQVTLTNPSSTPLTVNLTLRLPDQVSCNRAEQTRRLAPGGKETVTFALHATREFRANATDPALLWLELTPEGMQTETIPIKLIRRISAKEPLFSLRQGSQYQSLVVSAPGNEAFYWQGPNDLSGQIHLTVKDQSLLFKAVVTDDKHVQPYTGTAVWKGDGIQFALQLPGQNRFWKFGLTSLANGKPEVFCWSRPDGFHGTVPAIKLAVKREETAKETVYEATIPFSTIGMTPELAKTGFRFNVIVNDNDGELREGFLAAAPGLGQGDEPAYWPIINLP